MHSPLAKARSFARASALTLTLTGFVTFLGACADAGPVAPPATSGAPLQPVGLAHDEETVQETVDGTITVAGTSTPVQLLSALTSNGPCMALKNGTVTTGTPAVTATCTSGISQEMTAPALGDSGEIRVAGALCLGLTSPTGGEGAEARFYTCDGTASQQWKLTTAGEIRGVADHCLGVENGSTSPGARVVYWACNGSAAKKWSERPVVVIASSATILVSGMGGSPCMMSSDSTATATAQVVLGVCTATTPQRWTLPAIGATGAVRLGASLCLDLSGSGADGDGVVVKPCAGTTTQRWTRSASNTLVGVGGKCAAAEGSVPYPGTRIAYWPCSTALSRIWIGKDAGAGPVPVPAPPAKLSGAAGVLAMMAATNVPSAATQIARGGAWARYENDFATYGDLLWAADSVNFNANFYDRAMINYVMWARTGSSVYLDRANQLALDARTFMESQNFNVFPWQLMIDGVALHALITGDARSATAVARVADYYADPRSVFYTSIGNPNSTDMDGRNQARILQAMLDAWYLGVASPKGLNYGVMLRDYLTKVLGTQAANGGYPWPSQCRSNKPYMNGMLNDALIRYHTSFEADARIPTSVKRSVDYMWTNDWNAATGQFKYMEVWCTNEGGPTLNWNLNNLVASGYAFVARKTGDTSYYTKGDAIFSAGVTGVAINQTKEFNQEYTSSYRYLALRF